MPTMSKIAITAAGCDVVNDEHNDAQDHDRWHADLGDGKNVAEEQALKSGDTLGQIVRRADPGDGNNVAEEQSLKSGGSRVDGAKKKSTFGNIDKDCMVAKNNKTSSVHDPVPPPYATTNAFVPPGGVVKVVEDKSTKDGNTKKRIRYAMGNDDSKKMPPPPTKLATEGVMCFRGKLVMRQLGSGLVHHISGKWASDESKSERFEYKRECSGESTVFPRSGLYTGFRTNGTKICEQDEQLKFTLNSEGYHNVKGWGSNEYGEYTITGTLKNSKITLLRNYQASEEKSTKNREMETAKEAKKRKRMSEEEQQQQQQQQKPQRPPMQMQPKHQQQQQIMTSSSYNKAADSSMSSSRSSSSGGEGGSSGTSSTSTMAVGERRSPRISGQGKKENERLIFTLRVLMKYLERRDSKMHLLAKAQIKECYEKNRAGDPAFRSFLTSMNARLRATVGDVYWKKSHAYVERFIGHKQAKKSQSSSSSSRSAPTCSHPVLPGVSGGGVAPPVQPSAFGSSGIPHNTNTSDRGGGGMNSTMNAQVTFVPTTATTILTASTSTTWAKEEKTKKKMDALARKEQKNQLAQENCARKEMKEAAAPAPTSKTSAAEKKMDSLARKEQKIQFAQENCARNEMKEAAADDDSGRKEQKNQLAQENCARKEMKKAVAAAAAANTSTTSAVEEKTKKMMDALARNEQKNQVTQENCARKDMKEAAAASSASTSTIWAEEKTQKKMVASARNEQKDQVTQENCARKDMEGADVAYTSKTSAAEEKMKKMMDASARKEKKSCIDNDDPKCNVSECKPSAATKVIDLKDGSRSEDSPPAIDNSDGGGVTCNDEVISISSEDSSDVEDVTGLHLAQRNEELQKMIRDLREENESLKTANAEINTRLSAVHDTPTSFSQKYA